MKTAWDDIESIRNSYYMKFSIQLKHSCIASHLPDRTNELRSNMLGDLNSFITKYRDELKQIPTKDQS